MWFCFLGKEPEYEVGVGRADITGPPADVNMVSVLALVQKTFFFVKLFSNFRTFFDWQRLSVISIAVVLTTLRFSTTSNWAFKLFSCNFLIFL